MNDRQVLSHIQQLIDEEDQLHERGHINDDDRVRLSSIKVELDQCWDLLRQRRALRDAGGDPDQATVRAPGTVENYQQ